jgi:hypothetical protein
MRNANHRNTAVHCDTAAWTGRVLMAVERTIGDDGMVDVAQLARILARAPWWEGCPTLDDALLGDGDHRFRRVPLRDANDCSVLLIAWPPGYVTPIHDHDGLWGIELVLDGVLQVESFTMTVTPALQLAPRDVTLLGVGDHTTFTEEDYAHRCRNLSAQRSALSLHIYGGVLERYRAYDKDASGVWDSTSQRAELELAND